MSSLFDRLQQEIEDRERQDGMSTLDLLDLPPELSRLILLLARQGQMTAEDLAAEAAIPPDDLVSLMNGLAERGLVRGFDLGGRRFYRTYFARRRHRTVGTDIWAALDDRTAGHPEA